MMDAKAEQQDQPTAPTRNEELNPGPSYLDHLQDLETIVQHTPINERADSKACQYAYAQLKAMRRPKLHICRTCGNQYGNQETRIKEDGSNLYGICPWCEKGIVNERLQAPASVD